MMSYISGKIIDLRDKSVVILTDSGIGYEVWCTQKTLGSCIIQESVDLWTVMVHREGSAPELYGFDIPGSIHMFQKLTNVSGVGSKLALQILDTLPNHELIRAIEHRDVALLTSIPGIGKKTAEKIAVELQGNLDSIIASTPLYENGNGTSPLADTIAALESLGYATNDIRMVVHQIPADIEALEERISIAIKLLGQGK